MPKIRAFKGLLPTQEKVLQVIAKPFDQFYTEEAKAILQSNPYSFLHTIEPLIDNPYLRGSREEIIFQKAKDHFDEFVDDQILIQDEKDCIYVYRTYNKGHWQTGIWCVTAIDDYLDNTLRKHEHTRADREKDLIEYLDNTGIDANPVLVTYPSSDVINNILEAKTSTQPIFDFKADAQQHQLWRIDDENNIQLIIDEFKKMNASYIADGHHRAAASSLAGIQRRKNNLRHRGNEEYNFFSTLYFSFDQLLVFEFQRVVADLNGMTKENLLLELANIFGVQKIEASKPEEAHCFTMYIDSEWYLLTIPHTMLEDSSEVEKLDVSILQNKILEPLLGIHDPRRDKRIKFIGGLVPVSNVTEMVDRKEMEVAFFLHPTSIEELIDVADAGEVMPPKSTWFEPKLHCGLLVHKVD
jgi:uncharacterized protein (DUF1015 family)